MTRLALLVPGGRGQVGSELTRLLAGSGMLVHAPSSRELDVSDPSAVSDGVDAFAEAARDAELRPVVVNLAAYTAVDDAESDPQRAARVNAEGAGTLAEACRGRDVPMLHVSTDYVFPGDATSPYEPDAETGPRTVYGRTKLEGEQAVLGSGARAFVVRTAWVYGASGTNFVKTIARLEASKPSLSIVDDQVGSPTWAGDLAAGLLELAQRTADRRDPAQKVLHCTNSGEVSWFGLGRAIFAEIGADQERIVACTSAEYPRPAPRPSYSVLSGAAWQAAGLTPLRPWREALRAAFERDGALLRQQ